MDFSISTEPQSILTTIHAWSAVHWDERQDITHQEWKAEYQQRFITPLTW